MKLCRFLILVLLVISDVAGIAVATPLELPVRRIFRQPMEPFPGGGVIPAYRLRAGAPGVEVQEGDLAFDQTTEVGPGVQKILDEVGEDPQAAYLWVRNNVEYEPYFGIKHGAEGVAWGKTGNDFDQAALLASLLRSQGVATRFVYGVVRLNEKKANDWCGVGSSEEAYRFLAQAGVPVHPIYVGNVIKMFEVNHCWLEALLPYGNPGYRGEGERIWIPLDPL